MIRAEKSRLRGKVKGKEQVRDSTNARIVFLKKTSVGKFAFSLINKVTTRVSRNYGAHSLWEAFFGTLAVKRFFNHGPHR